MDSGSGNDEHNKGCHGSCCMEDEMTKDSSRTNRGFESQEEHAPTPSAQAPADSTYKEQPPKDDYGGEKRKSPSSNSDCKDENALAKAEPPARSCCPGSSGHQMAASNGSLSQNEEKGREPCCKKTNETELDNCNSRRSTEMDQISEDNTKDSCCKSKSCGKEASSNSSLSLNEETERKPCCEKSKKPECDKSEVSRNTGMVQIPEENTKDSCCKSNSCRKNAASNGETEQKPCCKKKAETRFDESKARRSSDVDQISEENPKDSCCKSNSCGKKRNQDEEMEGKPCYKKATKTKLNDTKARRSSDVDQISEENTKDSCCKSNSCGKKRNQNEVMEGKPCCKKDTETKLDESKGAVLFLDKTKILPCCPKEDCRSSEDQNGEDEICCLNEHEFEHLPLLTNADTPSCCSGGVCQSTDSPKNDCCESGGSGEKITSGAKTSQNSDRGEQSCCKSGVGTSKGNGKVKKTSGTPNDMGDEAMAALLVINAEEHDSAPCATKAGDTHTVDVKPVRCTTKIRVQNICCPKEATIIDERLSKLPGVLKIRVNVIGRVVHVTHDSSCVSPDELVRTLNKQHLGASLVDIGEETGQAGLPRSLKMSLLLLLLQVIAVSLVVGGHFAGRHWSMWISITMVCLAALPVFHKAAVALWNTHIDLHVLISITVIGALAIEEWLNAAALVLVFALADILQQYCFYRVNKTIASLVLSKPSKAVLASTGEYLPIEQIPKGSVIAVRQGELIPLDGVVVKGGASVDESSISGEATPVEKTLNSETYSGTVIQHGYLEIETTSTATSSTISKISEMVEDAQMNSSPTEILVNKFAKYYTPLVVLLAALVFLIPLFLGLGGVDPYQGEIRSWGERALIVLVTACPCALLMATPIVVIGGIGTAAKYGALIKGGALLEGLQKITTLAFDKTGTLTEGKFQVIDLVPLNEVTDADEVFRLTAALESKSSHPLSAAVVSKFAGECIADFLADADEIQLPEVQQFRTLEGQGISGIVEGHRVEIGNKTLLRRLGLELSTRHEAFFHEFCNESKTVIFACVDGQASLMISLADTVREESRVALAWLQQLGIRLAMLTGDSRQTAAAVKKELNLNVCISEMKPGDKLRWITDMREEMATEKKRFTKERNHVVGMVGDGVNDGPALAAADVGIAMAAGGSALAVEAAGVALMTNSVLKVPEMICLSRFCHRVIVQNVMLAVVLKLAFVIVAVLGYITVLMAVAGDLGCLLIVILNGLRALKWKPPEYNETKKGPPKFKDVWKIGGKTTIKYNTFE